LGETVLTAEQAQQVMTAGVTPAAAGAAAAGGAAALMLADARFPAGGHAHSGGLEAAVTAGTVADIGSLEVFLRGRLATAGVVAAGLAAAACSAAACSAAACAAAAGAAAAGAAAASAAGAGARARSGLWARLDAEADARTPAPAQRDASRRQGRALLRSAAVAWPAPWLDDLARSREAPHHPVVLGAAAAAAGCVPGSAAMVAAYLSVSGPASAAVRLLALDPLEVSGVVAGLAGQIEAAASRGASRGAGRGTGPLSDLPFPSAPALDLLAEAHARAEVRLFAS
jgi:urease accessory protein